MSHIDLRGMSLAHRILLGGAVALFIVMFFTWQGVSVLGTTVGVSGWHGLGGVLLGLATLALLTWEALLVGGEQTKRFREPVRFPEKLVSVTLAAAVLVLGVLKFLAANELRRWPEWVGLVLAIAIGYGGWLVYSGQQAEAVAVTDPAA
jgi:hypothetical protein